MEQELDKALRAVIHVADRALPLMKEEVTKGHYLCALTALYLASDTMDKLMAEVFHICGEQWPDEYKEIIRRIKAFADRSPQGEEIRTQLRFDGSTQDPS